jgi:hypothetical protein
LTFHYFRVDPDLTKFVHHDGNLGWARRKDVAQQRRFAAPERTGY